MNMINFISNIINVINLINTENTPLNKLRGGSSVLFAYLFLLLFGQIDNIYKVEQDSLYFFLKGDSRPFI